jgi:FixJ family two-component response regulator
VLQGICRGQSNKEIALDHDLHEATVKLHAKTAQIWYLKKTGKPLTIHHTRA